MILSWWVLAQPHRSLGRALCSHAGPDGACPGRRLPGGPVVRAERVRLRSGGPWPGMPGRPGRRRTVTPGAHARRVECGGTCCPAADLPSWPGRGPTVRHLDTHLAGGATCETRVRR